MNFKSKLLILGLISKIYAAKFSVVSFNGTCKLEVNGQSYDMTQEDPKVPLYTTTVDVPVQTSYKYVCGGVQDVERVLQDPATTHNELVGREKTVTNMPEFGFPNKKPWTKSIGRTPLFEQSYVPIVIINGEKNYFTGEVRSTKFNSITFVLKDEVHTFQGVPSDGKNYDEDKFQFKVTLPNGGIHHRDVLKFRPSSYDPVFFRQMLYGDIAHAIGNPAHESVAARVYLSDGTGIGLYVLQEDCTTESFIRTSFYGNPDTGEVSEVPQGPIYDCATGADFNSEDKNWLGGFISNDPNDLKQELLYMTQQIRDLDIMNDDAVNYFDENFLDLDTLFRALALEYLAGHWDSYWFMTTNFVVYHPPAETDGGQYAWTKYKYYFIDQDFDQTWGSNMKASLDVLNYPTKQYNVYINQPPEFWEQINADEVNSEGVMLEPGTRVILNKFIGCDGQPTCSTKTYFENHLKNIVQHIFNPVAIGNKANGYKERLSEEVLWDTQLTRLHVSPTSQFHFTHNDFLTNIEQGTGAFPYGILDWTQRMADLVCQQFGIQYDSKALTPEEAANFDVQVIEAGTEYDKDNLSSGILMSTVNIAMVTIATILSVVLLL